jgi:hypothetical protein
MQLKASIILLLFFFLLFCESINAQRLDSIPFVVDTSQLYQLKFKNGDKLLGKIISADENLIVFSFQGNELNFETRDIDQIYLVTPYGKLPVLRENFTSIGTQSQNLISETAYSLPKGQTEYRTLFGLFHSFDVGLTDDISAGGGGILPIGILGRVKFTKEISNKIRIGGGTMILLSFIDDPMVIAYPYINMTGGTQTRFINFNIGRLINFSYIDEAPWVLNVGGSTRIKENWGLTMDNYLVLLDGEKTLIPTIGAFWAKRKNRIDFGLGVFFEFDYFNVPFPHLAYTRRF